MMDVQTLAAKLNGCERGSEISYQFEQEAAHFGLVVVFGSSDDNMELRGAINDEFGCYDGGKARIDQKGLLPDFENLDRHDEAGMQDYFKRKPAAVEIQAVWSNGPGFSWTYSTAIPHTSFEVLQDGEPYCRGIVFALADIAPAA